MGVALGLIVLFFALIVISTLLVGLLLAAMYGLYNSRDKQFHHYTYGDFDFGNFQKGPFQELIIKLSGIIGIPIIVLPMLEYIFVGTWGLREHYTVVGILLFLFETVAFACGFHYFLKTDRPHTIVLTAVSAILYLLIYWIYLYGTLTM